jgi:hypothetical protein
MYTTNQVYTRNRHTVENDTKTALIKRINRKMESAGWKVKVAQNGVPFIIDTVDGSTVIENLVMSLNELAAIWKVTNATAGVNVCDITLVQWTPPSLKLTSADWQVPSYSSHY